MKTSLTYENFAQHLNTKFRIQVDDSEPVEATLSEISEKFESPRQERFSIIFLGPNDLGQGMRTFEHDQMGKFRLFVVPVGNEGKDTLYEAVFNRLRSGDQKQ